MSSFTPKPFPITKLKTLAKKTLQKAAAAGASQAEVTLGESNGFYVKVRLGEIELVEYQKSAGLTITFYLGEKRATVTTTDLSEAALDLAITKAKYMANYVEEDPCAGLAEPNLLAYKYPDLDLFHPWQINVKKAISLAKACEKKALAFDKRITNSEGVSISTGEALHIYANSHDFLGCYPSSAHSLDCVLIAGQGDAMQRDYSYTIARDAKDLENFTKVASDAAWRTAQRLQPKKLTTRRCPVIFNADVAKTLLGNFLSAINGYNLYRKSSFLLNNLGKQVFAKDIELQEKPHLKKGLGSAPFDSEGVKTKARTLVKNGILQSYVLDSYSGRQLKMPTTGNAGGVHNLFINTSKKDLDGLLKMMGEGLLITELLGQGANIVTGDYSRAAFGFWVEKGKIQYPVTGITIAGNLKDMFLNLLAVANDVDKRGNIQTGSMLIKEMMVGGD